ncbi:MAG: hypothetical protein IT287_01645 [Bdellovibrionaceae bacterium]|nr:hypothetical protein [Pseudobdellovibrionaceae bacterium]
MRKSFLKVLVISAAVLLTLNACSKKSGAQGPAGQNGGKIVSTINCLGIVTGLSGGASTLNGLEIKYNAVLTNSGDVYATASVSDEVSQDSSTAFYALGQAGATNGAVDIISDYHGTADAGAWQISLDRNTLITTVQYDDASLPSIVSVDFAANACTLANF